MFDKLFLEGTLQPTDRVPRPYCLAPKQAIDSRGERSVLLRVNNIRREYLMPYRAVKYDCVKLKGFFSYNSVIPCILDTCYIIAL